MAKAMNPVRDSQAPSCLFEAQTDVQAVSALICSSSNAGIFFCFNSNVSSLYSNKGRNPSNGELSDFSFYIDSQKSAHRKFKK
jgi:hypothetical protein